METTNTFEDLRELSLDNNLLEWDELINLITTHNMCSLRSLSVCGNQLARTTTTSQKLPSTLRSISLNSNLISSLDDLTMLNNCTNLENLTLRSNPLSFLHPNTPLSLPTIQTLDLSHTLISSLQTLNTLPTLFPNLQSLLISHTPLSTTTIENPTLQTIARIPTLTSLDHTSITPSDRQNAELYYLNLIARSLLTSPRSTTTNEINSQHPLFQHLCAKHGKPDILLQHPKPAAAQEKEQQQRGEYLPDTLGSRLINCTFYMTSPRSSASSPQIPTQQKELPKTITLYRVQNLVARLFGLSPVDFSLIWETEEWDPVAARREDKVLGSSRSGLVGGGGGGGGGSKGKGSGRGAGGTEKQGDGSLFERREVLLREGTQELGFYVEGSKEARIRVEKVR
ncbi:MAG: hypothetical protein Q9190_001142 [Brigantiaea leucoxantha]